MTAARPKLDIDATRDGLMTLGYTHAAEQLEQLLRGGPPGNPGAQLS